MLCLDPPNSPSSRPSTHHHWPIETGQQRQGKLHSSLREVCDLLHIANALSVNEEEVLFQHVVFKSGRRIHMVGQAFDYLYVVNSGFLKIALIDESGNEKVLGFPMKGDIVGADGINTRHYALEAVALSDCDIILVPFKKLTSICQTHPPLENFIYSVLSGELVREQAVIGVLAGLSAEARVAWFLLTLGERFAAMGYSSKLFNLRMSRHEIGSYLGLRLETISRTLSAFNEAGLITVELRTIGIMDAEALKSLGRQPSHTRANKRYTAKPAERAKLSSSAMLTG
jgi:CRP/FNR family transcriptional regulator